MTGPADVGEDATIAAIQTAISEAEGPEKVLGIALEFCQERTGKVIPEEFWPKLEALRAETGVPVVLDETATAAYRSGHGPFAYPQTGFVPDLLWWWPGGQLGIIHVSGDCHVPKPLAMASTWDGDELSLIRVHHQLRAARSIDVAAATARLEAALDTTDNVTGIGLYRIVSGDEIVHRLATHDILTGVLDSNRTVLAPALTFDDTDAERLRRALGGH